MGQIEMINSFLLLPILLMSAAFAVSQPMPKKIMVINRRGTGNNSFDVLHLLDTVITSDKPAVEVLLVGTNDFIISRKLVALDSFENNHRLLVKKLKDHAIAVLVTAPPFFPPYLLTRNPVDSWGIVGPEGRIMAGNTIIRNMAKENSYVIVDLYRIMQGLGGADTATTSLFINPANGGATDGVHPTANGYRVIAAAVYQTICHLIWECDRVICFGDSITYGLFMKFEGTAQGDTYPAALQKIFNN